MAFEVGIREDLTMPLGKIVSQGAHATCSFVLGCFDFDNKKWKTSKQAVLSALAELTIINQPAVDMQDALICIEDQGHTVFNGIPTLTTCLKVSPQLQEACGYAPHKHAPESTSVRLVLMVAKENRKKMGNAFVLNAVKQYTLHLVEVLDTPLTLLEQDWLKAWRSGAFAKITLNTAEKDLEQFPASLFSIQTKRDGMLVVGPASQEMLKPYTEQFRLL